jgi:hypothetical protein
MMPADIERFLRQHKDLEAAISSHNWWLSVFTIIVALGIFAETMVEFGYSNDKPRSEKWLTLACALVVLGGVIGEYLEGGAVTDKASQLQQTADDDVGRLYKEAGDANERAANADKAVAEARLETAKLEKSLAWRALSTKQKDELISNIRPFKGQRIDVFSYNTDPEAAALSDQFIAVFKDAKWDAADGKVTTYSKLLYGMQLEIGSPNQELVGNGNIKFVVRMPLTPTAKKASEVLASVLLHEKLIAEAPVPMIPKAFEGMDLPGLVPMSEAPIRLMIGVKPR